MIGPYTISWIRTYHTARPASKIETLITTAEVRDRLSPVDLFKHQFFDIQALRGGHFARAVVTPFRFSCQVPTHTSSRFAGLARCHILAHSSGFVLMRLTVRSDEVEYDGPLNEALFSMMERAFWVNEIRSEWQVGSGGNSVNGTARVPLNYIFLDLHERWRRRVPTAGQLSEWAQEGAVGCERLHHLTKRGEIHYPFPVSFGTQIEFATESVSSSELEQFVQAIATPIAGHPLRAVSATSVDITRWYLSENQSFTLSESAEFDSTLDVLDPERTQLLEYLSLRRAALRSVQRDSQRILTEGRSVTRKRVEEWRLLLSTTTDDYVLHDRVSQFLSPVRLHLATDPSVRDPAILEAQVRSNVDSFQSEVGYSGTTSKRLDRRFIWSRRIRAHSGLYPEDFGRARVRCRGCTTPR